MCENYSAPAGERSIVMTVSVCFCAYLSKYASDLYPIFVNVTHGCGSVLGWRRCNTLCTSGFMHDVILAHKPMQLNVAAQLMEAQPTCSLGLGYRRKRLVGNPLRDNGLTLTGLLFGRRGVAVLGRSGRVEYS